MSMIDNIENNLSICTQKMEQHDQLSEGEISDAEQIFHIKQYNNYRNIASKLFNALQTLQSNQSLSPYEFDMLQIQIENIDTYTKEDEEFYHSHGHSKEKDTIDHIAKENQKSFLGQFADRDNDSLEIEDR